MAGTLINFENKKEEFTLKLNEVQASHLYDFICKFEKVVDKDKMKKVFLYDTEDIDYIYDCVFKDIKQQMVNQADKAITETGLDLCKPDEALKSLRDTLEELIDNLKDL